MLLFQLVVGITLVPIAPSSVGIPTITVTMMNYALPSFSVNQILTDVLALLDLKDLIAQSVSIKRANYHLL